MSEPMKVKVELEVQDIADAIIRKLTEDGTLVEVVRCKDCKRWKDPHDGECPYHATGDPYLDGDPEEDFFCAYGERKEDE